MESPQLPFVILSTSADCMKSMKNNLRVFESVFKKRNTKVIIFIFCIKLVSFHIYFLYDSIIKNIYKKIKIKYIFKHITFGKQHLPPSPYTNETSFFLQLFISSWQVYRNNHSRSVYPRMNRLVDA